MSNFHLLFYIRKQKNYKGGAMPIYMRITVNGKRADMSAGRECESVKWNGHAGRAIGAKEEIKSLNNYLIATALQTKLRNAHQVLIDANQQVTTEKVCIISLLARTKRTIFYWNYFGSTMPK